MFVRKEAMKMKLLPLLLILSASVATATFEVSPMGIKVAKAGYGKNKYGGTEMAPFNGQGKPAAEIAFLVKSDDRKMIKLDEKKSSFAVVKDDQGGDLLTGKTFMGKSFDFVFPKVSEDGKALLASVRFPILPKKGSSKIEVQGEFVVITGSETQTLKAPDLELKNGVKFSLGDLAFVIKNVGESEFDKGSYEFTLETNQSLDRFKEYRFLDDSGEKIEVKNSGRSSMTGFGGGKGTFSASFKTKKKLEKVTIVADVYTDFKSEKIAVKQVVSLGL